jgi:hypothetical protein
MVVEIEGVQKIIRRIRDKISVILESYSNPDSILQDSLQINILIIEDDCKRLVSLILAETGHWQQEEFVESLQVASKESAILEEDIRIISQIPIFSANLMGDKDFGDDYGILLIEYLDAAEKLCQNISSYIIHTELPV